MAEFIVKVPEEQEMFFKELMNQLNFRHYSSESDEIPEWHKAIIRQRRQDTRREDYIDWDTMMEKLEENA